MKPDETTPNKIGQFLREPVVACLCGLDTNPVASPRMDIHCPKHDGALPTQACPKCGCEFVRIDKVFFVDLNCACTCHVSAPEAGSEPELLPDQVVAMIKESVDCEYNDLVGYKARFGAALVDLKLLLNTHVSRPADWLRDNEIKRLKDERNQLAQQGAELWERANTAQPSSTPADELNYDAAFRATDSTTAVASYQDCSGSAAPLEPNSGWDDAEQGLMPTPADEEVARAPNDLIAWKWAQTLSEDEQRVLLSGNVKRLQTMITTALAEARRAGGTPTTDARAKSVVDHLFTILARDYNIELTNNDASERAETVASALSSTPGEQKHVDYVFDGMDCCKVCGLVRPASGWKKPCSGKTPELSLRSTPSAEVAQRARAAAEEIQDWNEYGDATGAHDSDVTHIEQIILKHLATDVEQGTCTWACEPAPDIEMWETDCGNTFQFEADGPTENKMKFCCYCGKRLAEKVAEGREEGEGDG